MLGNIKNHNLVNSQKYIAAQHLKTQKPVDRQRASTNT